MKNTRIKRKEHTVYFVHDTEHNKQRIVYYAYHDEYIKH